jgi:hypothetical protein
MKIKVKLNANIGDNLGPNFTLTGNVGTLTPSSATRTQLLSAEGIEVIPSNTSIATVTVTADGGFCAGSSAIITVTD